MATVELLMTEPKLAFWNNASSLTLMWQSVTENSGIEEEIDQELERALSRVVQSQTGRRRC